MVSAMALCALLLPVMWSCSSAVAALQATYSFRDSRMPLTSVGHGFTVDTSVEYKLAVFNIDLDAPAFFPIAHCTDGNLCSAPTLAPCCVDCDAVNVGKPLANSTRNAASCICPLSVYSHCLDGTSAFTYTNSTS
jgi:hypothetical protein